MLSINEKTFYNLTWIMTAGLKCDCIMRKTHQATTYTPWNYSEKQLLKFFKGLIFALAVTLSSPAINKTSAESSLAQCCISLQSLWYWAAQYKKWVHEPPPDNQTVIHNESTTDLMAYQGNIFQMESNNNLLKNSNTEWSISKFAESYELVWKQVWK